LNVARGFLRRGLSRLLALTGQGLCSAQRASFRPRAIPAAIARVMISLFPSAGPIHKPNSPRIRRALSKSDSVGSSTMSLYPSDGAGFFSPSPIYCTDFLESFQGAKLFSPNRLFQSFGHFRRSTLGYADFAGNLTQPANGIAPQSRHKAVQHGNVVLIGQFRAYGGRRF
jgi:hypothetical protein